MSERKGRSRAAAPKSMPHNTGGFEGQKVHPDFPEEQFGHKVLSPRKFEPPPNSEPTATFTIEHGKCLHVPTGKLRFVGYDQEGKGAQGPELALYREGETIDLPVSEGRRLQQLGFLVDPNRRIAMPPEAPRRSPRPAHVNTHDDGPHVNQV